MSNSQRLIESDRLLRTAAATLRSLGLTEQPALIEALAGSNLPDYIDKIVECSIAAEREKLQMSMAAKLALERIRLRQEYEFALAMKGSGIGGWNSQGHYTIW